MQSGLIERVTSNSCSDFDFLDGSAAPTMPHSFERRNNMHTKESLSPYVLQAFADAKAELPSKIAHRLTSSNRVRNHGSYRTFYLFNVWDLHQADILHRDHFCYCLGYLGSEPLKQRKNGGHTWFLDLWINKIRLYRSQSEIRQILEVDINRVCPKGFVYRATDRFVEAKLSFEFDGPLSALPEFLTPQYVRLISSVHPVLLPIIDSFTEPLSREERRAAILGRKRRYFGPQAYPTKEHIREYTRSIPPSWRAIILKRFHARCVRCGSVLTIRTAHMDHILPFSKGGGTTLDNLQPLCAPCNLKKGSREDF